MVQPSQVTSPRVTVSLAVYNVAPYLRACIDSILEQSMADLEVIAVDDGSTDGSGAILESYSDPRMRVLHQHNQGLGATRRRILSEARGEFIAVMDGDDVNLPRRFSRQVAFLDEHPEVAVVGGQIIEMDEEGHPLCEIPSLPAYPKNFLCSLCNASSMYRRIAALEAGNYSAHFARYQDNELLSRMLVGQMAANLPPPPVLLVRIRRGGLTTLKDHGARRYASFIRRQLKELQRDPNYKTPPEEVARMKHVNQRLVERYDSQLSPCWIEARYSCRLGRSALRAGNWRLAIRHYSRSIRQQPVQWLAYTGLFRAALRIGKARSQFESP